MPTAIIRPTAHIASSNIIDAAKAYDNNTDTWMYAKVLGSSVVFKGLDVQGIPKNISKINNIRICVISRQARTIKGKVIYGATSTADYTDCGDDSLGIECKNLSGIHVYSTEYPQAAAYWNNNLNSFLAGDIQFRLYDISTGTRNNIIEAYIEVEYELPKITVTVNASSEGGGMVTGGGTYESGSTVTATATANSGYVFSHWLINGADSGVTTPTISGALTEDTTVTAVFSEIATSKVYNGTQKVSVYCGTQRVSVYCGTKKLT